MARSKEERWGWGASVCLATLLAACGPANHSAKVDSAETAVDKRDACRTRSDCDKLKADAKDLLEECKGMMNSSFWARKDCDKEANMVQVLEKKEYENLLRSSLTDRCKVEVGACLELHRLSEKFGDERATEVACGMGCAKHKDPTLCGCGEAIGNAKAASIATTDCRKNCFGILQDCLNRNHCTDYSMGNPGPCAQRCMAEVATAYSACMNGCQ